MSGCGLVVERQNSETKKLKLKVLAN